MNENGRIQAALRDYGVQCPICSSFYQVSLSLSIKGFYPSSMLTRYISHFIFFFSLPLTIHKHLNFTLIHFIFYPSLFPRLCSFSFQGKHSLSQHLVIDHPDFDGRIFACKICNKSYRHYAHLRSHRTSVCFEIILLSLVF